MTKLLQAHDKTLMEEELFFMDEQKKLFLEMESTADEDAVRIVVLSDYIWYNSHGNNKIIIGVKL